MGSPLIAVLGGGQLGRMLGLAGVPLGLRFRFLDPSPDAPAAALGPLVVGDLGDEGALGEVAAGADLVTYEWEGVPAAAARSLERRLPVRPGPLPLEVAQDRLLEKETCRDLDIAVPESRAVDDRADLHAALDAIGLPAVLKTRRGGYDGKGQTVLRSPDDVDAAYDAIGGVPLLLEALVPFERELSLIAARGLDGETACYPLVENRHADGMLRVSRAPAAGITPATQRAADEIAGRLLDHLDYVGVLAVELFDRQGTLLVNEIAPRVHNSGHWTIEGAETSQFEQHLRAVLGWPLGSTAARGHAAMVNCIGVMPRPSQVLAIEGARLHDYAKTPRPGRKLGHVTVTAPTDDELETRLALVVEVVPSDLGGSPGA